MTADVRVVGTETAAGIGLLALCLTVVIDDGTGTVFPLILCLACWRDERERVVGPDACWSDERERVVGPEVYANGIDLVVGNGAETIPVAGPIPAKGGRNGLNACAEPFNGLNCVKPLSGLNVGIVGFMAGNGYEEEEEGAFKILAS